jgi:transposase
MMGTQESQSSLFSYQVNLDKRVRPDNPLRRVKERIDFSFVRAEVAALYGYNGNESVPPETILKMMFLLFFDDVASERELMRIIPERLDYLWFLGYGLDELIPDHSVLSKARKRWGAEAFESFFARTVAQCVARGLVDGKKIHVDASLNDANASNDSVVKGSPELIAALKAAYQATESKLEDATPPPSRPAVNDCLLSATDPDAAIVRKGHQPPRPRYHNHRAIDDAHGVITAVETTSGSVAENKRLLPLVEQHEANTQQKVQTAVADHKYGTSENFIACQQRSITTHLGDTRSKQNNARCRGIFPDTAFSCDTATNTYRCPAGQTMHPRRLHPKKRTWEYTLPKGACAACSLRAQCTRAAYGRTIHRHEHQELLDQARAQAHSAAAQQDRKRRQHLAEGSFADAANNHGFKRLRWRRLWRARIQDLLIAGIQNIKILLKHTWQPAHATVVSAVAVLRSFFGATSGRKPPLELGRRLEIVLPKNTLSTCAFANN